MNSANPPITIISSGPQWMVLEKCSGISIHNNPGRDVCSLALSMVQAGKLPNTSRSLTRVHAAHRIDKDTSGIVLLAVDSETLAFFGRQFADKTVRKGYLALVHGHIDMPIEKKWVDWAWPLTAAAAGRNDPMGKGRRLPCTTRVRLLEQSQHYSLIECEPFTGRKHQIRRHAKLAGHTVVGDRRYGSARSLAYLRQHHKFDRLALHAHTLTICLPGESKPTTFQSKGVPEQLWELFDSDR